MKVLYAGNFTQIRSTEGYVADALEAVGVDVTRLQDNNTTPESLLSQVRHGNYTHFLFSKCELVDLPFRVTQAVPERLAQVLADVQRLGCRTVAWLFDLMRNDFSGPRWRWSRAISQRCDMFITTDTYSDGFRNHRTLRQGYPGPAPHVTPPEPMKMFGNPRIAHLGEVYGERKAWFKVLSGRLGNDLVHARTFFEEKLHALCRSVSMIAGPHWPYFPGYWSNRVYLVAGYGGCFVAPIVPGMQEEGWEDGVNMIGCPLNAGAAAELLADLVQRPDYTRRIAKEAALFAWDNHTYIHRADILQRWLKDL